MMLSLHGPVGTIFGGMAPLRMLRPSFTSSRGCVSGGSPIIIAMRR
jgi:hypothetical protein